MAFDDDDRQRHRCASNCFCCHSRDFQLYETFKASIEADWGKCHTCHRNFLEEACYTNYIQNETCKRYHKCVQCRRVIDLNRTSYYDHECGRNKCTCCQSYVDLKTHKCFIQKNKEKKTKKRRLR